jgi:gliding motility-associated-like protein
VYSQSLNILLSKTDKACLNGEASISMTSGQNPIQILWSNGITDSTITNLDAGDYFVKITDNLNEDTTIYFTIEQLICKPAIENYFSPNGDNYADTWSISGLENFPDFELFVYNRWGQIVHHQVNNYIPWDGKSFFSLLPDATYYYILYLSKKDRKKFASGDVTIIR